VIYLKMPSIQSTAGHSSQAEYSADGLYSFMTIFHSAASRGVENATIRAFNASRACPDGKSCTQATTGTAAGGQFPLTSEPAGPMELSPIQPGGGSRPGGGQATPGGQPGAGQPGGGQAGQANGGGQQQQGIGGQAGAGGQPGGQQGGGAAHPGGGQQGAGGATGAQKP
jgi:hypothetical protein